ncbi:hypothetical protein D7X99_12400 [Corallococcus sp. AB032C]|uniref:hypothetical protein n=1 Tax=Corallococcus TaxID=83461 RepID=UPI000EDA0996|nr:MULTISPECIES: hypothetical protein [Corallococcus]NPC47115.1 hypothetical protein [Corallococcus exiguus]RKH83639.1 hypothetical protein D7X99_12400 [Corallococcus sp. AB032C]
MPIDMLTTDETKVILKTLVSIHLKEETRRDFRRELRRQCLGTTPDPVTLSRGILKKLGYDELLGEDEED